MSHQSLEELATQNVNNENWQPRRCDNPWKPNMHHGQSEVYRRMLGILNRVTQQSMHHLLQQALELPITHPEHLPSILSLLLSKSQDEPLFSSTYALLCAELSQRINIQASLSAACQVHFTESLQRLVEFEDILQGPVTVDLIQEEILARKRLTVHIGFVCELERKGIVPIIQLVGMAETLLEHGDLRSLECLCRLLSFSGARLTNAREDIVNQCYAELLNRLNSGTLSPRLRYLLQDTVDLRANGWRPRVRPNSAFSGRNVRG